MVQRIQRRRKILCTRTGFKEYKLEIWKVYSHLADTVGICDNMEKVTYSCHQAGDSCYSCHHHAANLTDIQRIYYSMKKVIDSCISCHHHAVLDKKYIWFNMYRGPAMAYI